MTLPEQIKIIDEMITRDPEATAKQYIIRRNMIEKYERWRDIKGNRISNIKIHTNAITTPHARRAVQ